MLPIKQTRWKDVAWNLALLLIVHGHLTGSSRDLCRPAIQRMAPVFRMKLGMAAQQVQSPSLHELRLAPNGTCKCSRGLLPQSSDWAEHKLAMPPSSQRASHLYLNS